MPFHRWADNFYIHVIECVFMMKVNKLPGYEIHDEKLNDFNLSKEASLNRLRTVPFQ